MEHQSTLIQAFDNLLAVKNNAVLPAICVKTNRPLDEGVKLRHEKLLYTPKGRIRIGPFGILLGLVQSRFCEITYGIEPHQITIYRLLVLTKVLGFSVGCCGMFLSLALPKGMQDTGIIISLVVALACGAAMPFGNTPLKVVKRDGDVFFLKGFNREFLDRYR